MPLDLTTVVGSRVRGFFHPEPAMPLSDDAFLSAFLAGRLEPAQFDHRGHLRTAWLLLQRHPLPEAVEATCRGIQALAARFGADAKFHRTRTEALVRLMAPGAARAADWAQFLRQEAELVADARALLARHYSPALLDSDDARHRFLPPDRAPLPA